MAFISISRLASKRLLQSQQSILKAYNVPAKTVTSAIQESLQRSDENHDEKNTRLKRPMSPHVTIYKFEMPSILSISHRITGLALSTYAIGFGAAALCMTNDFNTFATAVEAWNPGMVTISTAKFIVAFPLMYHTCNGIRHLIWDTGASLNKRGVITTGSAMLAATVLTTLVVMLL